MIVVNVIILLLTALGLGLLILPQPAERKTRFTLLSVSLLTGLPVTSILLVILGLFHLPVAWWSLLPLVILGYWRGMRILKGRPGYARDDAYWLVAWLVMLGMMLLMLSGSMQYPWLEDGDPWEHALTASYVRDTHSMLKPEGMYIAHYLPPYPPGMAVLEGAFWLTGTSIAWLKVFISLIIGLMYPAFYLFMRRLTRNPLISIIAVILAGMLPGVTHFIYAQQPALLFTLVGLAWLPPAVRRGKWLPYALASSAVLVTQQITSIFHIGSSILLYASILLEDEWRKNMRRDTNMGEGRERNASAREEGGVSSGKGGESTRGGEREDTARVAAGHEARVEEKDNDPRQDKGETDSIPSQDKKRKEEGSSSVEKEHKEERMGEDHKAGMRRGEVGGENRGSESKRGNPFARVLIVTLAFTLTILILAGSFYLVMFKTYGKQGVFGTYGISEKEADSVWWHYIHPPEKRCPARLMSVDPSCKHPYYTFHDFYVTSSANSIDAGKGLGQAVTLLTLLGVFILILRVRRNGVKDPAGFLLAWFIFTLLGVYGDALPVAFLPHRWWAFLTWPVAGIAAYAVVWLSRSVSTLAHGETRRILFWSMLIILLGSVWMTSMQPKIGLNMAVWPPHGFPTGLEYAAYLQQGVKAGYLALPESPFTRVRMADVCSNTHSLLAGVGIRVPSTAPPVPAYTNNPPRDYYMWDIKNTSGKPWMLNTSNLSMKLKAYAAAYHVDAFTIGTSCLRQARMLNESFENYAQRIINQLVTTGWQPVWQRQGVLVMLPPRS